MPNEDRVHAILEDFMGAERVRVSRTLGYPPRLDRMATFNWWQHQQELAGTLYRSLRPVWQQAAEQFRFCEAEGLNMTQLDRQILSAAEDQAMRQARQIAATTARQVGQAVQDFRDRVLTRRQYYSRLREIFTGHRLETIAASSTTQAAVKGMRLAASACERARNQTYRRIWYTAHDERVCPVCGPLHGTSEDVWGPYYNDGLMAHPQCRCWIEYRKRRGRRAA